MKWVRCCVLGLCKFSGGTTACWESIKALQLSPAIQNRLVFTEQTLREKEKNTFKETVYLRWKKSWHTLHKVFAWHQKTARKLNVCEVEVKDEVTITCYCTENGFVMILLNSLCSTGRKTALRFEMPFYLFSILLYLDCWSNSTELVIFCFV